MSHAVTKKAFTIRTAVLADAAKLAPLAGQLGYPSTSEQIFNRLREILQNSDHVVFVAERDRSKIVGYVEVFAFRTIASHPRVEIGGLVVDESCRSQGAGRLLMERAEDWSRARGYRESRLRSNVLREGAHRFYQNLGYRVNKTQKSFIKTL